MRSVDAYTRLAGVYDEIVVDPCHGRWAVFLDALWSGDPDGVRSVLDLCCGTGLLAAELVELGYRVTGVDASAEMLALARERLGSDAVLEQAVLPELPAAGPFDAVTCTFDGLNYLSPADLRATLAAAAARLRPGGWLVFDLHTDAMLEFTLANPVVSGEADGNGFTISSVIDRGTRLCDTTIEVGRPRDGEPYSEHHRQWFHGEEAVRDALAASGLGLLEIADEYSSEPADAATLRATWIARRPR